MSNIFRKNKTQKKHHQIWNSPIIRILKLIFALFPKCLSYLIVNKVALVVKNSLANAGDSSSIPELGRSPGEKNGSSLQYSCLKNSMGRGAWQVTIHGAVKVRHDWAPSSPSRNNISFCFITIPIIWLFINNFFPKAFVPGLFSTFDLKVNIRSVSFNSVRMEN